MSPRAGMRCAQSFRLVRASFRKPIGQRSQTTDAAAAPTQSTFQRLWNSPIGVKTVHFWAPVMKWSLVLAGVSDFARPAESLSLMQNLALTATGAIWTRWCFVIKPKNMLLAAVNFFLGCVGVVQVARILTFQQGQKDASAREVAENDANYLGKTAKAIAQDPDMAAKTAIK